LVKGRTIGHVVVGYGRFIHKKRVFRLALS
jgi:hypothetical protein